MSASLAAANASSVLLSSARRAVSLLKDVMKNVVLRQSTMKRKSSNETPCCERLVGAILIAFVLV
jgi:hypothetical protein